MRKTLLLMLVVAAACRGPFEPAPAAISASMERDPLIVRGGKLERRLLMTGQLEAARGVSIGIPFLESWRATIKWLEADGAVVKSGQKVADLDTSTVAATLQTKREAALQAAHQLSQNEARLRATVAAASFEAERTQMALEKARIDAATPEVLLAQREYQDRQMRLQRAAVDYAKAVTDLEAAQRGARADIDNLRLALERARGDIATVERSMAAMTLVAPDHGIVVVGDHPWEGRKFQVGDTVWTSLTIMSIPDLSTMQIRASLPDVDDGKVSVGDSVVATIDAYPSTQYGGRIERISAVAQETGPQSLRRAFSVVVKLDRVDPERMRPGLSVKVNVVKSDGRTHLLIPRTAIDLTSAQPRVRLADGSLSAVRVGPCNPADCIVVSGLVEGTRLSSAGGARP